MLHIMLLVGMPGTLLLFLSGLLLVKTLQLCHGRTCPACTLEGLEQRRRSPRVHRPRPHVIWIAPPGTEIEKPNSFKAADTFPKQTQHRAVLQILYSLGHRSSSDSTRTRRGSSALLWFSTQVLQSFFYKFRVPRCTSARPVP